MEGYTSYAIFGAQMIFPPSRLFFLLIVVCIVQGCANIVPPQGGAKDITPPRLVSVTPPDSQLQTRVTRIELRFDEFITVSNPAEVTISPLLPFPVSVEAINHRVIVRIPDSLLRPNTTYRISFGKAIQDVHESNAFYYNYIFSTGAYFDSLKLGGSVTDAATGLKDTGALVVLYEATTSDSAVVRQKPLYAVKADGNGQFLFQGLPDREFRIYTMHDANNNMIYDGKGEMIGFADSIVHPAAVSPGQIPLYIFSENPAGDTVAGVPGKFREKLPRTAAPAVDDDEEAFSYTVKADTSEIRRRSLEITAPLEIGFNRGLALFNPARINLSYDSSGISVEAISYRVSDTLHPNLLLLNTAWKENTVYTLRLLKGFARDSANTDAMPGRYSFRTKRDEDYAKLHVHLPSRYAGREFIFVLLRDNDSVYQQPVTDTMIHFTRLQAGSYSMRVIADRNKNGKWDPGNLLEHIQPEQVIPYLNPVNLKPGWENIIDFDQAAPNKEKWTQPPKRSELKR